MSDNERLVRIEEGQKSVGRSIDTLRGMMESHIQDGKYWRKEMEDKQNALELNINSIQAGKRVLIWVCGLLPIIGAGTYVVISWINKVSAALKGVIHDGP